MSAALKSVFDSHVVANILAFVPLDDFQIETLYGFTHINGVKHYITYGGGPEGGFVYFTSKRRNRGRWYRWNREWFAKAGYARVETGQVAFLIHDDGSEQIAILPDNWETTVNLEALAETVMIADDGFMREVAED